MKIGFGLYRHMLDDAHFAFARQCGATHIVVHMCDYFRGSEATSRADQPVGDGSGWGIAEGRIWSSGRTVALRDRMARHGLTFFAIENFDPGHLGPHPVRRPEAATRRWPGCSNSSATWARPASACSATISAWRAWPGASPRMARAAARRRSGWTGATP